MTIDINELRQLAQGANEHPDDRAEILAAAPKPSA